jgi:TPR repeat protein
MELSLLERWLGRLQKPALNPEPAYDLPAPDDAESQFSLAQHFEAGPDADQALAMQWYRKAAEKGHGAAQFNLALIYAEGKGVLRDQAAALIWLQRAAEKGHGTAQYHLGVRLHRASKSRRGQEASQLRIEALQWLQLAVAQSCQGADSAREFVLLGMTRQEVDETEQRAQICAASPERNEALPGLQTAAALP